LKYNCRYQNKPFIAQQKKSPAGKQGCLGISNLNAMNPGKIQVLMLPGCKACINYLLPIY